MNKIEITPSLIIKLTIPRNQDSRNYKVEFHGLRIDAKSGDTVSYNHKTKQHFLNGKLMKQKSKMTKPKGKPAPSDTPKKGDPPPIKEKERIVKAH